MLQNKFEMPLDLAVKTSKIFSFYFYLVIVFSIISIFISSLSLSVQLLLIVLLFVVAVLTFKKQNINKITSLKLSSTDEWEIEINNEKRFDAELQGECIVTYFLIWLNFTICVEEGKSQKFHILLLPDSAAKNLLRKLRVRLRFLSKTNEKNPVIASDSAAIS